MKDGKKRLGPCPSQMKNTLQPHADPTHLEHLSSPLSSPALRRRAAHMKIAQVIKVRRGSSLRQPRPADSVQTDVGASECESRMENDRRQGEQKMKKGPGQGAMTAEHIAPGKLMFGYKWTNQCKTTT